MKKYLLVILCLLVGLSLLAEPLQVAVGYIDKKDSSSGYIVNSLLKRDLKGLFEASEKYELMDIKKTEKQLKSVSEKDFKYLLKEEKLAVGQEIGADIIIWGDVTAQGSKNFKFAVNILSVKTEEFLTATIEMTKNKDERMAALEENLLCELDNSCESSLQIILDIAMQQYAAQNLDQAEESFLAVLGNDAQNVQAMYYLGAINYIKRDYETSKDYFLKARELEPENDDILNRLSLVYSKMEMYEEAVEALMQLSDHEENPVVWMRIAELYRNIEYYTEAIEAYESVIAITDTMNTVYLELSNMLYELEYFEDALEYMEEAVRRYPDDDALNKKLATAYKKTGKIESAIEQYRSLIEADENNLRAYYNLANSYTSISDYEKALAITLKLQEKDPENPSLYILQANSYSSLKQYTNAEKSARKALEYDAENYQAYRILSEIYQGTGYEKYDLYLKYEEQAKTLYGNEADAMIEKRDSAKQEAYDLFTESKNYLKEAKSRTNQPSELSYIKDRESTLNQLLEATKKSFF